MLRSHYRAQQAEKRRGHEGGLLNIDDYEIVDEEAGNLLDELMDQETVLELFKDLEPAQKEIDFAPPVSQRSIFRCGGNPQYEPQHRPGLLPAGIEAGGKELLSSEK